MTDITTKRYNFCVRDKVFTDGTHIMGILNCNQNSFYVASRVGADIVDRAKAMIDCGAEIIDLGAQSTAPGAPNVSALEELSRLLPAIEKIRAAGIDIPLSIDTFYSEVAKECIECGADMINDVSCLEDGNMADVVARQNVAICISHNRRKSKGIDLMLDKYIGLNNAIATLKNAGVDDSKIILDGGIGFNLSREEDWCLYREYPHLIKEFGAYPFLLGTSRKSMFGGEVSQRLTATLDTTIDAVKMGVLFVRVHDVKENKAIIDCYSR